jgi:hypothetical protein
MNARSFTLICGALTVLTVYAQETYPAVTLYFPAIDYWGSPAADAPFCGERRNVRIITQSNGMQKTEEYAPSRVCRDSAGRTRYESPVYLQPGGPPVGPMNIQIRDPVAGFKYLLYALNKTVYRQEFRYVRTVHPPLRMPVPADKAVLATEEDLGIQMMDGVRVEGRRYTLSPGSSGNDTTVSRTAESWWSPDLAEFVLEKTSDAVKGEMVHRLTVINREEPDPNLFRLPADYAVAEKSGDFTIVWGK